MMIKNSYSAAKQLLFFLLLNLVIATGYAQIVPLPYSITNLSEFSDDQIYMGLVGKIDGTDVWIDLATGEINEMQLTDNTLQGPVHNGNNGPGGDAKYADCFTQLSNIPNNTIDIPHIYAVRIFISFKSPLYLYFFGDGGGYSAPSLSNDSDPNLGIKYELIELTYGDNGLWTNTTRVDAYQYPMGLEVWGEDGFYKRVGEILTHEAIIEQWQNRVGDAFQSSLDEQLEIILNPSKSSAFQEGETYNDYFSDYVDAVWARYETQDMYLSIGEAGVWRGRVSNDQFIFTNQSDGTIGMISAKPNTLEIMEASGVLAEDVSSTPDVDADKNIQKHFSAAFNRGAIALDADSDELLEWSDINSYFGTNPHNHYVAFWHSADISFEGETYAFAYDDVFDYSSTIQSTVPEKVNITIGGFVNDPYVAPTEIVLSDTQLSLLSEQSAQLNATLLPADVDNPALLWESSDETVATVSNGLVMAISTGVATITVSSYDGSVSDTANVEVNNGDYSNETTQRIEAEDYSEMFGIATQQSNDSDGTLNVGWIDTDDYMQYQLTIESAGEYTIAYRIASIAHGAKVEVQVNDTVAVNSSFDSTGSWSSWDTQLDTLTLPAGDIKLRLVASSGNWNINWFELTLNETDENNDDDDEDGKEIEEEIDEQIDEEINEEIGEQIQQETNNSSGGGGSIGFGIFSLLALQLLRRSRKGRRVND